MILFYDWSVMNCQTSILTTTEHLNCVFVPPQKKLVLHLIVRIVKIRRRQFSTEFNNRMMTENVTNDETTKRRNKRHDQIFFFS